MDVVAVVLLLVLVLVSVFVPVVVWPVAVVTAVSVEVSEEVEAAEVVTVPSEAVFSEVDVSLVLSSLGGIHSYLHACPACHRWQIPTHRAAMAKPRQSFPAARQRTRR